MATAKQPPTRKKRFLLDDLELTILSLPTAIWYIAFCYIPMFGVVMAFKNYRVKMGQGFLYSLFVNSDWVGFKNFQFLFRGQDAYLMFRNTLGYNLVFIVLGVLLPVALAILISQMYSQRLAKACQTSMFLPHFLSWVVVSYFVFAFLSMDKGLINQIIRSFGGKSVNFYQESGLWVFLLIFLNVWKSMGYGMVVYLARISGIDTELYEAALIDGASKWQQVKYITLPMLRPIMSIMFILSVGNIFRSDFGLFYQATRNAGALSDVTMTIDVYVFKLLIERSNVNYSSAAGLLQSALGLVTILGANLLVKKIDPDAGLF
ncbi:MAG: ABC transporter permease subunit [Clostridia bacterium]|nr:ABC transporter permease subunit [Clostridia bacterium]